MSKNKVQFQEGYSLIQLFQDYGTENQCHDALFKLRWPRGFNCLECGCHRYCFLKTRKLYQCNNCHHQTSLISGTIFEQTKLPLTRWFLAIHLITQSKTGLSALALKREIGVSYNTAWSMKHKIMQVMKERDDSKPLGGTIQLDDVYWGGERHGGKRGRGSANKVPLVAAVSLNEEGYPIAMK
jgi:transposase-like protein